MTTLAHDFPFLVTSSLLGLALVLELLRGTSWLGLDLDPGLGSELAPGLDPGLGSGLESGLGPLEPKEFLYLILIPFPPSHLRPTGFMDQGSF